MVGYSWCKQCGGEMVSCECENIDDYDDYDGPVGTEDDYEPICDKYVIWVPGEPGGRAGHIEVVL